MISKKPLIHNSLGLRACSLAVSGESRVGANYTPKYRSPAFPGTWGQRWVGGWNSQSQTEPTSLRPAELLFRSLQQDCGGGVRAGAAHSRGRRAEGGTRDCERGSRGRRGRLGAPRRGGIPGETASRSQRGGGQKSGRGRGRESSRWMRPGPGSQNRNRNPCARLRLSRGPHRWRPPLLAARAPARAPEPGEPALRSESPPASGAGASRPGRTGTSRPSREPTPTGASGRSRCRRLCRPRKSPGLRGMGSSPRR